MMKADDDEQWLRAFVAPLLTEYERQTADSACIAPARFWQVACRIERWSDADQAHLRSCVRCAEHDRQSRDAIVSRFGDVPPDVPTPLEPPRPGVESDETAVRSASSGETVLSSEARRQQALGLLNQEHRQLIQWRVLDEISTDEVARRLGWTRQKVLSELKAARTQFHQALAEVGMIVTDASDAAKPSVPPIAILPQ